MECARLVEEAENRIPSDSDGSDLEARRLYQALKAEFHAEGRNWDGERNLGAQVESIYTRITGISGPPLTDGYHFGQTIYNDYGRPYQEGFNMLSGLSSHAEAGPLAFYVRGEYQHAPGAPAISASAAQAIVQTDTRVGGNPLLTYPAYPDSPIPSTNRFDVIEAYVGLNVRNWQVTAGKQSLWWSPDEGSPMMFGNNAEAINMVRLTRVSPIKLPSILGILGPIRTEFFVGRLAGQEFVRNSATTTLLNGFVYGSNLVGQYGVALNNQPFISGSKFSMKPTPNLEFGFSRNSIYGGPGYPFTMYTFLRSIFSYTNQPEGSPNKPGNRQTGFDMSYRIPKLRRWLTFYADGYNDDEFTPVAYWDRSVWYAGLFMPEFPRIPKLDLRVEGGYTDNPVGGVLDYGYYFANGTWRSGFTNDGNIIGTWMGREGQGAQAWATYHFNAKSDLQLNFRHEKVSSHFLDGGGTIADFGLKADVWLRPDVSFSGVMQHEQWNFPVIVPGARTNFTTSVQLTFWPKRLNMASKTQ